MHAIAVCAAGQGGPVGGQLGRILAERADDFLRVAVSVRAFEADASSVASSHSRGSTGRSSLRATRSTSSSVGSAIATGTAPSPGGRSEARLRSRPRATPARPPR